MAHVKYEITFESNLTSTASVPLTNYWSLFIAFQVEQNYSGNLDLVFFLGKKYIRRYAKKDCLVTFVIFVFIMHLESSLL